MHQISYITLILSDEKQLRRAAVPITVQLWGYKSAF